MDVFRSRLLGISVAVAHGVFSGSLNILLKFLISNYHFSFLTLIQLLTSSTAALTLETLRRLGKIQIPPFSLQLCKVKTDRGGPDRPPETSREVQRGPTDLQRPPERSREEFGSVCILSTLQSTLTLWSLRGLSLPMYVVFKRCLPLFTLSIGVCILRNGVPSVGVVIAVIITTGGAALAGAGDLTGDPFGYITGVLAVIVHASYLVLIQKTSLDSEYGPLTAQYAIAIMASPVLLVCSLISMDTINMWTFVGVVKSIATITVGMLAFNDVAPTRLFIGGVVVNTIGSITYCVVKYFETKKKSLYEDLEEAGKDGTPPGEPYQEKPPLNGDGPAADPGNPEMEGVLSGDGKEEAALDGMANGVVWTGDGETGVNSRVMTEKEVQEMQREHLQKENTVTSGPSASDSYVGVWRSIRHLQFMKKEPLIDNMEQQSP
ncbi:Solute carrier family 35 member D3 Fringe connection-like protein 1 [Larimichthys crocea]|uniref:Solute carrier family 35 member D3 Fringe connection-like protein 1 n=1 Tax=Larimichthys crocea TaxID=215358 RepID=A0A6G0I4R1_LARCR|nr:Solute carrier family 35 member D3 Fringe connection-like protein 1 [Larimichthys crocea]